MINKLRIWFLTRFIQNFVEWLIDTIEGFIESFMGERRKVPAPKPQAAQKLREARMASGTRRPVARAPMRSSVDALRAARA